MEITEAQGLRDQEQVQGQEVQVVRQYTQPDLSRQVKTAKAAVQEGQETPPLKPSTERQGQPEIQLQKDLELPELAGVEVAQVEMETLAEVVEIRVQGVGEEMAVRSLERYLTSRAHQPLHTPYLIGIPHLQPLRAPQEAALEVEEAVGEVLVVEPQEPEEEVEEVQVHRVETFQYLLQYS